MNWETHGAPFCRCATPTPGQRRGHPGKCDAANAGSVGLTCLALVTPLLMIFARPAYGAERPNVLWIIAEDFSPDFGIDGVPELHTPHLDRLIGEGMRFRNAFATGPVCSISRSAFMTGMYQTTIGANSHRSHRDGHWLLPEGGRVVTDWLRDADYFTANIVHLPGNAHQRGVRGTGKTDWNFTYQGKPFDSKRWSDLAEHQPFYAQINFHETHRGGGWKTAAKHIDNPANPEDVALPPFYPDDPRVRKDWAAYLNNTMVLDEKVGRVLELLEASGLAENTVVIFFSDHGRAMPRGKQFCYEGGLHVPLVVRWPEGIEAPSQYEAGSESDQIIELIDVTATTLAIAGVPKPEAMQGRVFLGEEADPPRHYAHAARDRCDGTVMRIRAIRDTRYRYIRNYDFRKPFLLLNRYKETMYPIIPVMRSLGLQGKLTPAQARLVSPAPRPREEFYDLKTDPFQIHNLANSPEQREVLTRMRRELEEWLAGANDELEEEDPAIVRHWIGVMKHHYHKRMERQKQKYPKVYPLDPAFLNTTWLPVGEEPSAYEPTESYRVENHHGWTVRISAEFGDQKAALLKKVLKEIDRQLVAIEEAVPSGAVAKLRQIEIWIDLNNPRFPCMCYHGEGGWLRSHGVNPDKTDQVELANARNFLTWTDHQPWMVFHELAHGYHDRFLKDGFENQPIAKAYDAALDHDLYGDVEWVGEGTRPHYAATNPMEYFAEASEAFFGKNDFYPYKRRQFIQYDPHGAAVLRRVWGVQSPVTAPQPKAD